jgi:hypothetical protein
MGKPLSGLKTHLTQRVIVGWSHMKLVEIHEPNAKFPAKANDLRNVTRWARDAGDLNSHTPGEAKRTFETAAFMWLIKVEPDLIQTSITETFQNVLRGAGEARVEMKMEIRTKVPFECRDETDRPL